MSVSTFKAVHAASLDRLNPTTPTPDAYQIGVYTTGGAKNFDRNSIATFDLTDPDSGDQLHTDDTLISAEIRGNVFAFVGSPGWSTFIKRLTRPTYDYLAATYNEYRSGEAWTAPGGDTAYPGDIWNFPTATGDQILIPDPIARNAVAYALASDARIMYAHFSAFPPAPPSTQEYQVKVVPRTASDVLRLIVTYTRGAAAPDDVDRPAIHSLPGAPPAQPARAAGAERPAQPAHPWRKPRATDDRRPTTDDRRKNP